MGQPFLYTTSRPQHDAPVGKSCSWYGGSLFVYIAAQSPHTFYDYDNYLYVLLIRPTHLYTYMFTTTIFQYTIAVSPTTINPITPIIIIILIHKPVLFIISVLLYLPSYLQSVYIYCILAALYLRGETRGTLFRLSCPFYICILILIRSMYTNCHGPPG